MFEKKKKGYWFHNSLMFIVGAMGIVYAAYLGLSVYKAGKESLLVRTSTIAQFITAKDVASLHGSEEDLNNPAYLQLKDKLMSIRLVNPDIRFIYLNGMRDGKLFFYMDSEKTDSSDYSPPGQQYDEASDSMKKMFQKKENVFGIAGDRWGVWTSALVPIIDSESGKVVALLGMDVPAKKYMADILTYCLSALLFAALVMLLLVGQKRVARHMHMEEESLEANKLEIMNLKKIIDEKEQKIDEIKKKASEI